MPMIRRLVPLLSALALLAASGCGKSSSSNPGPADARAFCLDASNAVWDTMRECGFKMPPRPELPYMLGCQVFQAAQDNGRVAYHEADAADCVSAIRNMRCVDAMTLDYDLSAAYAKLPASCQRAMEPQVESGGKCGSFLMQFECVGGSCEVYGEEQCYNGDGVCVDYLAPGADCGMGGRCQPGYHCETTCVADPVVTVLGPGGDCTVENTVCRDGLYCDGDVCAARAKAGQSCATAECLEGLRCDGETCVAPLKADAPCTGYDCAAGLYCNPQSVCAPYPVAGESCDGTDSVDDVYCSDSFCDPEAEGGPTCAPYYAPGDWCPLEADTSRECGPGLTCTYVGWEYYGVCAVAYCPYN